MDKEVCCGTCRYHLKEKVSGEWVCTDHDGEYFGCETGYEDKCPDWEKKMIDRWIPIGEQLPPTDKYILLSFENFGLSCIGRYEEDEQGNGAFYEGDDDTPLVKYDLYVNAWTDLPERYDG